MIVRILSEGQWVLDAADLPDLNTLDAQVEQAVACEDQPALTAALAALLAAVRAKGQPLPDDVLSESDLILPEEDATLAQVTAMLADTTDGLIPG